MKRDDSTKSCPDAELVGKGVHIVVDAKWYSSTLDNAAILKTLDDMKLRDGATGIIVCSEDTVIPSRVDIKF